MSEQEEIVIEHSQSFEVGDNADYEEQRPLSRDSVEWSIKEAGKLLQIARQDLDIFNKKIKLSDRLEPITFFEYLKGYKEEITYNGNLVSTREEEFIKLVDDFIMSLKTTTLQRLNDGFRRLLEAIKHLKNDKQSIEKELKRAKTEVDKLTQDVETNEKTKLEISKIKGMPEQVIKKLEKRIEQMMEDLQRDIDRLKDDFSIVGEPQKPQGKVILDIPNKKV